MKKIILFIFIIIFINYNTEVLDANTEKLPKVSIKTVKKEFISESYIVTSRIAPFKSDTISVKSPGPIEDVYVEVGDFVKKGDVLLKIENDELEADKNKLVGGTYFSPNNWKEKFLYLQKQGKIKANVNQTSKEDVTMVLEPLLYDYFQIKEGQHFAAISL